MSLYSVLFDRVVFPAVDRLRTDRLEPRFRFLLESDRWSAEQLRELQTRKLTRLLRHAQSSVPYYRSSMRALGADAEHDDPWEILGALPTPVRRDLTDRPTDFLSGHVDPATVEWSQTSGTSGVPLKYVVDRTSVTWAWAAVYRYYRWMGVRRGDPALVLWGARGFDSTGLRRRAAELLWRRRRIPASGTDVAEVRHQVEVASEYRPVLLRGYASALLRFARVARDMGVRFRGLKAVSPTAELTTESMRHFITEALGAPLFDQYGCRELQGIAYECEAHDGMHVVDEHVLLEVEGAAGNEGDVLLTDLDNFTWPLIRYRNGDRATTTPAACSCGRAQRRLVGMGGRTMDSILLADSTRLDRTFFGRLVRHYLWIRAWQVEQTSPSGILFRVEGDPGESGILEVERDLERRLPGCVVEVRREPVRIGPTGKVRLLTPLLEQSTAPADGA